MKQHLIPLAVLPAAVLLASCGAQTPTKPYNPTAGASTQADAFIGAMDQDEIKKVDKVAVTACNVLFAQQTSASASTSAGLFHHDRGNRAEARVSVIYSLEGLSNDDMQAMTDRLCTQAEQKLAQAGYDVVSYDAMKQHDRFAEMLQAGKPSPYEYKVGPARYQVFTRSGATIFDPRYIGTASGLGQAFSRVSGDAAAQHETVALDQAKVTGVNINLLVDFAEMQSSGDEEAMIGKRDTAKVSSKIELSVSGDLVFLPLENLNCWSRFGNRECEVRDRAKFYSLRPVNVDGHFYDKIENTTTTSDKVTSAVTSTLAFFGSGKSQDTTRYTVNVNRAQFETVSDQAIGGLMDMVLVKVKAD